MSKKKLNPNKYPVKNKFSFHHQVNNQRNNSNPFCLLTRFNKTDFVYFISELLKLTVIIASDNNFRVNINICYINYIKKDKRKRHKHKLKR